MPRLLAALAALLTLCVSACQPRPSQTTTSAPAPAGERDGAGRLRALLATLPERAVDVGEIVPSPPVQFGRISAVAPDARGNLYVFHRPPAGDPVVVLDPSGRVLRSWGAGRFAMPHGIRVDPAGNVWTVDAHTSVVTKFTPAGDKLLELSLGPVPDTTRQFCGATDVAFTPGGHVLVADGYCNARVVEFDARGRRVREWGRRGSGPGEFFVVHSVAVGPDGNVYVADRENGRVQRFSPTGEFLSQWTYGGQLYSLAFAPSGELYVGARIPGGAPGTPPEGYVLRIDRLTGAALARVRVMAHELAITADGALLPATLGRVALRVRP
jgi:DNA-binding beta-propeller fold protein YncE